jgi:hypothetical protein
MEDMSVIHNSSEVSNWTSADMPGASVAASVIEKAIAQSMAEPNNADFPLEDQNEDDTYIDDGSVAPVHYLGQAADDDFFVQTWLLLGPRKLCSIQSSDVLRFIL